MAVKALLSRYRYIQGRVAGRLGRENARGGRLWNTLVVLREMYWR